MKRISTLAVFIVLLFSLVVGYFYFFVFNKEHPDFENLKPEYVLEAAELYKQFTSDPKKAQLMYGGKMIQVKGNINTIEKLDSLTIAVYVFNEGMFGNEGVRCTFLNEEAAMIQDINDVQNASIKGFCSGFNDTDVILEKCSVIK